MKHVFDFIFFVHKTISYRLYLITIYRLILLGLHNMNIINELVILFNQFLHKWTFGLCTVFDFFF